MSVALALVPVALIAFMETEPEFETVLPLDPDEVAAAEEVSTDVAEVLAELGGSWSSGNTENVVLNSSLTGSKRKADNRVSAEAIADLGRAMDDDDGDGTISDAERSNGFQLNEQEFSFEGRYDRFLTETDIGYATTGWLNDPFSGYRSRIHQQIGYGRVLMQTEETRLISELGFDVAKEWYTAGVDPTEGRVYASRAFVGVVHTLSDTTRFSQETEWLVNVENIDDVRISGETALTLKATDVMNVQLSYELTYESVPVEGYRALDQSTQVTLVATLF
jgi:putative salt-induced outer membrane protein YdiY